MHWRCPSRLRPHLLGNATAMPTDRWTRSRTISGPPGRIPSRASAVSSGTFDDPGTLRLTSVARPQKSADRSFRTKSPRTGILGKYIHTGNGHEKPSDCHEAGARAPVVAARSGDKSRDTRSGGPRHFHRFDLEEKMARVTGLEPAASGVTGR